MRNRKEGLVTVKAIAGTHVVFLAMDMKKADARDLMGFAIQRKDLTEGEVTWLRGNKSFDVDRRSATLDEFSSLRAPFQDFQWADYSAKPGYVYEYSVFPMFGAPGALTQGPGTSVRVKTEKPDDGKHGVYFNRGAIASQAYARRFGLVNPKKAGQNALDWLARDLLQGLKDFVGRALDSTWSLHAAIYETKQTDALGAFSQARKRRVKIKIVYGAKRKTVKGKIVDEGKANLEMLEDAGLKTVSTPRKKAKIAHNKFIVLSHNGEPQAVWTGSTNFSDNAIFGQLNVGHVVNDAGVAKAFLHYWEQLKDDPDTADLKIWIEEKNPVEATAGVKKLQWVFSPHASTEPMDWFVHIASLAQRGLFMTFPFGIGAEFRKVYDKNDDVLRFALLDKYYNGGGAGREPAIADTIRIRKHPNVGMAVGHYVAVDIIDGWLKEFGGIGVNVDWVHTKFMLVDPLGDNPVVITGSANWSKPSTDANDENMLVIGGDKRVADIYFGEFMRLFAHHRFREAVARHIAEKKGKAKDWKPRNLEKDPSQWVPKHYEKGSEYAIKRDYYAN